MILERARTVRPDGNTVAKDSPLARLRARLVVPGPVAVALAVIVVAAFFIERGLQSNAGTHLYLTVSILDRGTLNIDPFHLDTVDLAGANGHFYADKAPGLSLLALPFYAILKLVLAHGQSYLPLLHAESPITDWERYILAVIFDALPTGIIAALLYRFMQRMGVARGWCAALGLTYGLGTIARPYASVFFSHQFTAALCFGAFYLLYRLRKGELDDRFALLVGLLLGYSLISEYPTALIVAALGVYLVTMPGLTRERLVRLLAYIGIAMVPSFIIEAVYNSLAFGSPLALGYNHLAGPEIFQKGQAQGLFGVTYPHLDAIWGTTFSPYRGIFLLSPVLLLAIPGGIKLVRRVGWRAEGWLCAAIGTSYFLFNFSYFAWDGGASMGPRQILPCLPFLMIPIGELVRPVTARGWRRATTWLAAYSIFIVELCAAVHPIFNTEYYWPITQIVLPRLVGLPMDNTRIAPPNLVGALWHQFPLFLGARLDYNWAQLPDLPGMTQLYPLAALVAIILLWATLRAEVFPRMQPHLARFTDRMRDEGLLVLRGVRGR